jgi:hypothetical protein
MSAAADNIRAFTRQTRSAVLPNECIAAPEAYQILGAATELAHSMPQALRQLGDALRRSLTVYDVYDTDAAQHLLNAQTAIRHLGINQHNTGNLRRRPTLRLAPE